ncbi:VgrG-related protein [Glycomyces sp. NPDC049804]|uniref:VgrG-related protein n=1 Tax=Glycomyces sp. NPDC049804 TaxID=3154363 RepID=UPI003434628C
MANESFANTLQVSVNGTPLPADVATMLTQAAVTASRNLPDACHLRFRDPENVVVKKTRLGIGVKVEVAVQAAEPGSPQRLMSGEVVAMEIDIDAAGTFLEVRGLDPAHRLFRGRRVAAYPKMGLADVVHAVAVRAGLQAGTIDDVKGFGEADSQISQDNVSDWEFLSRLADQVGAQVTASDGKLNFRLPDPPKGAPPESATAATDPLVLEPGVNLIALRAAVSAAEQVGEVNVRGWDFEHKKEIEAKARPTTKGSQVDGVDPVQLAGKFNAPPYLEAGTSLSTQGRVQAYANALAAEIGATAVELDGVAKGNPKLAPGAGVTLANVSDPFGGKYTLTSARHVFNEHDGYTTAFTVSGRAERTLYGLTSGGGGGAVPNGLVSAVVSDARDPMKLGRVKVTLPWLSKDFTTTWARTVSAGGGAGRGLWAIPEVGDEVLVGFADGDMDHPYVLGGLHNGKDTPPKLEAPTVDGSSGEIGVRALVSRDAHRLELVDDQSKKGILLSTGDGKLFLRMDATGKVIELKCSGEVKVSGMGVKIDAGSGPLELSGSEVKVTGRSKVEVSATTVKVAGQGSAELSASGSVTVRGGIVRIN